MTTNFSQRLVGKLKSKVYRAAYVAENIRMSIAFQMKAMREQRDMSQSDLGKLLGKPQSVVSRLENPEYGKATVQTLLEVAEALDVALVIKFVPFPEFISYTSDVSPSGLQVDSFSADQFENRATPESSVTYLWTSKEQTEDQSSQSSDTRTKLVSRIWLAHISPWGQGVTNGVASQFYSAPAGQQATIQ